MTKVKFFLMVVLLIGFVGTVSAQKRPIDSGSINIGGAFSLTSTSGELYGESSTSISLIPGLRYFIADGLAVGGDLLFQSDSSGGHSSTTIGIGPTVAYFFDAGGDKLYPYLGAGVAYINMSQSGQSHSFSGFQLTLGGGMAFMLKPNLALLTEITYAIQSMSYGDYDAESGGRLAFSVGLAAFIY